MTIRTSLQRLLRLLSLTTALCVPAVASAGFVTTNESGMDAIFSQASFGRTPIDIRFNAAVTIYNSALLAIDSAAEFSSLVGLNSGSTTAHVFFVDDINWCGSSAPNIIGCGAFPGNTFAVDSAWAANPAYGAALLAHELGHNLGLPHLSGDATNLMYPFLTGNSLLDTSQVATLFGSPLVQMDNSGHFFIAITPYAIVSSQVIPEPGMAALFAVSLLAFGMTTRRRRDKSL